MKMRCHICPKRYTHPITVHSPHTMKCTGTVSQVLYLSHDLETLMRYWQKRDVSASSYDTFILDWIPQVLSGNSPNVNLWTWSKYQCLNLWTWSKYQCLNLWTRSKYQCLNLWTWSKYQCLNLWTWSKYQCLCRHCNLCSYLASGESVQMAPFHAQRQAGHFNTWLC